MSNQHLNNTNKAQAKMLPAFTIALYTTLLYLVPGILHSGGWCMPEHERLPVTLPSQKRRQNYGFITSYWVSANTLYATTMFTNYGKLGEKRGENYLFIMTCITLIGSYCEENINIGSWHQVSGELLLQNHKRFICASVSPGNPTPRTKLKN